MVTRKPTTESLVNTLAWATNNYPELCLRPRFEFQMLEMLSAATKMPGCGTVPITAGPPALQIEHNLHARTDQYREPLIFTVEWREGRHVNIVAHANMSDRSYRGMSDAPLWFLGGTLCAFHEDKPFRPQMLAQATVVVSQYATRGRARGFLFFNDYMLARAKTGATTI